MLAIHHAQYPMFIRPPFRKAGKEFPHLFAIGVKDMRAIAVYLHAMCIQLIKGIAANVWTAVNQVDLVAGIGQSAGNGTAGEACAGDECGCLIHLIPHFSWRLPLMPHRPSQNPAQKARS